MCRYDIENCNSSTPNPLYRQGHSAILYSNYEPKDCALYIDPDPSCTAKTTKGICKNCQEIDENYYRRETLERERKEANKWYD
jgi:hypothetical protein